MSVTRQAPPLASFDPQQVPREGASSETHELESTAKPKSQSQNEAREPESRSVRAATSLASLTSMLWEFTSRCHASGAKRSRVGPICSSKHRAMARPPCRREVQGVALEAAPAAEAVRTSSSAAAASRLSHLSSCSPGSRVSAMRTYQPSSQGSTEWPRTRGKRGSQWQPGGRGCCSSARMTSTSKTAWRRAAELRQQTSFKATSRSSAGSRARPPPAALWRPLGDESTGKCSRTSANQTTL
mmetsp:Transcript_14509/g.45617  ORF Transcript_14509/g.45617 Transcript_14509/m.45617 type:complete len:242 (+) Transcript_14509:821-1546(+)